MSFQVIAGSGHCGTMWLATVLNSVPGQRWTHELRTTITGMPWQEADGHYPDESVFTPYWQAIRAALKQYAVVGDSNSWPSELLPRVNRVMTIDRVIYLTRDKERQLYSIMTKSPIWSRGELGRYYPTAERRLTLYAQISGLPRDERLLVDANDFMPNWLRAQGLPVEVYSLEELTTDIPTLRTLAPLTDVELQAWQRRNINQKVGA